MSDAHFDVSLNIPHAAKVAARIQYHVGGLCEARADTLAEEARRQLEGLAGALARLFESYTLGSDNPAPEVAQPLVEKAAAVARDLVDKLERAGIGSDRLGQAVRNFFECLELGEEGARISLRAGEDPRSLLRPI